MRRPLCANCGLLPAGETRCRTGLGTYCSHVCAVEHAERGARRQRTKPAANGSAGQVADGITAGHG